VRAGSHRPEGDAARVERGRSTAGVGGRAAPNKSRCPPFRLAESEARPGDILVWRGVAPDSTPHSAVLTDPVITPGMGSLDEATRLQSKNGMLPEQNLALGQLIQDYGEAYNVFRRR
jgi:hypothetical protein